MDKTILVVDDDQDIVKLITESLRFEQFEVIPAYSGKEALSILKENQIDFVVLNIMMPEMDGLEVCRNIRNNYNIPILFLSARDRDIDKIIGLEIGADDYMTKPFSIQELTSRIKAYFRKVDRLYKAIRDVDKNLNSTGFKTTNICKVDDIKRMIDGHLQLLAVMLIMMSVLGVIIGGIGLSTTMSINVLERTREIGIMRAIRASTHSIFRIIVGEGVLIGLLSWVFAAVIATPVSIFISYMFGAIFFETPLKIAFSPIGVFICLVLAMVFAALSSLYPVYKASKMSVREVLSYE